MNRNYLNILPRYFSIKKAYKINNILKLKYIISEINTKLEYSEIKEIFDKDELNKTYYFINKRFRPKIIRKNMSKTHFYSKNFYKKGKIILLSNNLEKEIIKFAKKNKYFVFEKSILKYNSKIFKKVLNKCKLKLQEYMENRKENFQIFIDDNNYYKLFIETFECNNFFMDFKNAFISKIPNINMYVSTYDLESDSDSEGESDKESIYKHDLLDYRNKAHKEREINVRNKYLDLHLNFFPFAKQNIIEDKNLMNNFNKYLLKLYEKFFGYNFNILSGNDNLFRIYITNNDESKYFKKINKTPKFKINE